MKKRIISIILTLILIFSVVPTSYAKNKDTLPNDISTIESSSPTSVQKNLYNCQTTGYTITRRNYSTTNKT